MRPLEGTIRKIIEKIGKKRDYSKEVAFTSEQYAVYSKSIREISKKYKHVGKYLSISSYKDICNIGFYPRDGEYLVAVFDTDDHRNDKEIRSYELGDGNHDFVEKLEKEIESFVKELNSSVSKDVKFDHDFDGHRFDLFMSVDERASVKESADEFLNEAVKTYTGYPYSGKTFRKIPIEYYSSDERVELTKDQKAKFNADFAVVKPVYDEIFKSKFIPWLLGPLKNEDEKKEAVKSLEMYNITYFQRRDDIGEFEFQYLVKNPGNKAKEPVAFCVSVKDGKAIKTSSYDI